MIKTTKSRNRNLTLECLALLLFFSTLEFKLTHGASVGRERMALKDSIGEATSSPASSIPLTIDDFRCAFDNSTMAEFYSITFHRSPYNCRVYHICAFGRQFSYICAEGLLFDERLDTCNFEHEVECTEIAAVPIAVDVQLPDVNLIELNETAMTNKNNFDELKSSMVNDNGRAGPMQFQTSTSTTTTTTTTPITTTTTMTSTTTTTTTTIATTTTSTSTTTSTTTTTSPSTTTTTTTTTSSSSLPSILKMEAILRTSMSTTTSTTRVVGHSSSLDELNGGSSSDDLYSEEHRSHRPQKMNIIGGKSTRDEPILTNSYTVTSLDGVPGSASSPQSSGSSSTPIASTSRNPPKNIWQIPEECVSGFDHKIPSQNSCAFYYECSKDGKKTLKVCPYPLLYDEMFSECRPYEIVECGTRKQAKDLCDYQPPSNETGDVNREECEQYPSCRNLSDGLYPTNDCRHYFQCKDERTLRIFSCPRNITTGAQLKFNYLTKRCDFIENVSFNCGGYAIPIDIYTNNMVCPSQNVLKNPSTYGTYGGSDIGGIGGGTRTMIETKDLYFSHPRECSIYIGCDEFGNMSVLECLNGTHFSPYYQSCVHASIAQCKKYATIDQTPINISLRLLIMNNSLKNFDLELFNNSNETILEESFLSGGGGSGVSAVASNNNESVGQSAASETMNDHEEQPVETASIVLDSRSLSEDILINNKTLVSNLSNVTNQTQV